MEVESVSMPRGFSWSAVFAGTFVFLAIEVTFAMLAAAIFGAQTVPGRLSAGAGIWIIILSIIALYFGAKAAAHFCGATRRLNGMYYGLVTFGLSIFSSILVGALAVANSPGLTRSLVAGVEDNTGWLFVTLLLAGIAAVIGGFSSVTKLEVPVTTERATLRPAA
jgi:hypothetical protein